MFLFTKTADADRCAVVIPNPEKLGVDIFLYNATGGTVAEGQPVMVTYGSTMGKMASASAPATSTFPVYVAIARESVSSGSIGKFAVSGKVDALVDDTGNLSVGRMLEVINSGTYLVDDGATSRKTTSVGVLMEAVTANEGGGSPVLKEVNLIGEPHTIAAS